MVDHFKIALFKNGFLKWSIHIKNHFKNHFKIDFLKWSDHFLKWSDHWVGGMNGWATPLCVALVRPCMRLAAHSKDLVR